MEALMLGSTTPHEPWDFFLVPNIIWLVVLTILKNMKVNGKDDIPYMTWKIKAMFETTNQL